LTQKHLVAGSVTTGIVDAIMEAIWESDPAKWTNKFPFVATVDPLPPADDWIVLAIPTLIYGYGRWKKSEVVKVNGYNLA
jgi:hypothetical protein